MRRAAAAGRYPVATDARVGGDDNQTRFVVDLSRKVDLRAFTLADPYRVVIDLPQVTFQLPPKTGESGRGLIKAFRFGLVMQGGSRIVLDVDKPVRIDKAFVLDAAGRPAGAAGARSCRDRPRQPSCAISRSRTGRAPPAASRQPRARAGAQRGDPRPIVVLDPGHGGIDNGTMAASGEMEKDDRARISRWRCATSSRRAGKYRVVMTRTDDSFVPLAERVRFARIRQAALFISIHADALRAGRGRGAGRDRLHAVGNRLRRRGRRGLPRARTAPT